MSTQNAQPLSWLARIFTSSHTIGSRLLWLRKLSSA